MPKRRPNPAEHVNDHARKKQGNRRRRQFKKGNPAFRKQHKSFDPVQIRLERELAAGTPAAGIPAASGAWPANLNKCLDAARVAKTTLPKGNAVANATIVPPKCNAMAIANTCVTELQKVTTPRPKDFSKMPPELQEDPRMWKYWKKPTYLFSRYHEGIKMDKESWYSVTPEPIARKIAQRRKYDLIIDAFCGVGGNAIQFAMTCGKKVLAIDIDPIKIEYARHNAAIYGVTDKIEFYVGDFFKLVKLAPFLKADMVFLSPPWGGPDYQKESLFDIETIKPCPASELVSVARTLSNAVYLYLPRNSNMEQIHSLADEHDIVEIEKMMGGPTGKGKKFQTIMAYYDFYDTSEPLPMAV